MADSSVVAVDAKAAASGVTSPDLRTTPTFIINLRRRLDREDIMEKLVHTLGLRNADGDAVCMAFHSGDVLEIVISKAAG